MANQYKNVPSTYLGPLFIIVDKLAEELNISKEEAPEVFVKIICAWLKEISIDVSTVSPYLGTAYSQDSYSLNNHWQEYKTQHHADIPSVP